MFCYKISTLLTKVEKKWRWKQIIERVFLQFSAMPISLLFHYKKIITSNGQKKHNQYYCY